MTKWRLILLLISLVCILALSWLVPRLMMPTHRINGDSFERIQDGMTLTEVEDIIGVPPGIYTDPSNYYIARFGPGRAITVKDWHTIDTRYPGRKGWYGDNGWIWVELDQDGRVIGKSLVTHIHRPNFLDRIRGWLGW
jgi:hypothetical protein